MEDIPPRRGNALPGKGAYPQSAYRKGGVFNLRLNTPVAKATSLFRKRNSEPLTAPSAESVKGDFASAEARRWTEPVWQLSDRPRHPFGSLTYKLVSYQRRQVAAALSAAVTTTKPIGEAPNSQAEPTMQKQPTQTPAALREGARGRGFSQRSRLPRIPRTFPIPRRYLSERRSLCAGV